jgi:hypothetical protein
VEWEMIQKSSFFVLRNVEIIFFVPIAVSEVTVHCYFGWLMAFCVLNIWSMIREGNNVLHSRVYLTFVLLLKFASCAVQLRSL